MENEYDTSNVAQQREAISSDVGKVPKKWLKSTFVTIRKNSASRSFWWILNTCNFLLTYKCFYRSGIKVFSGNVSNIWKWHNLVFEMVWIRQKDRQKVFGFNIQIPVIVVKRFSENRHFAVLSPNKLKLYG